ncbi:MAG: hypothetical protein INR62_10885, partial [Rhodospirillales bacterium]|nr:hypothetical protein [Acetobacter sp.]
MTAQQAVLSLTTVSLAGCGGVLVLIRGDNPLLKGLNWMGWALGVGGLAAGLTLLSGEQAALHPLANLGILLAFIFGYRAERYLLGLGTQMGRLASALLGTECLCMALQWTNLLSYSTADLMLSIFVALQLANTARIILQYGTARARRPAQAAVG